MIYVPNPPPCQDFVIVVGEDSGRRVAEGPGKFPIIPGVTTEPFDGYRLLRPEGNIANSCPDGPVHFSGIAFRDGRLVTRAEAADFTWGPDAFGGKYTVAARDADGLIISCDEFGIGVIFVCRSGDAGPTLISNNLHFLVTVCRHCAISLHVHEGSMLKRLMPYQLGQQPSGYRVFFDEIELLGVGRYIRVKDGRVRVEEGPQKTYASYSDALDAGLTAMREQVRAVASFARYPVLRLSGGFDSRTVFGVMAQEALVRRSWCWTFPRLENDFRVAKLLVNFYQGEFAEDFPWLRNTEAMNLQAARDAWSSRNFGLYSNDWGIETHRRTRFDGNTVAILNGGGGECFRDFYFKVPEIEERGSLRQQVRRLVRANRFPSLEKELIRRIADVFVGDVGSMPGNSVKRRLRAHYLNFRNRFHFGFSTNSLANRMNFSPLMQSAFLDAAEFLRESGKDHRQIFVDMISALDERLLAFPFDNEEKSSVVPEDIRAGELPSGAGDSGSVYDPVSIAFKNRALFQGRERSALLRSELYRATAEIADRGIYSDLDMNDYRRDIEEIAGKNVSTYNLYVHSVISTANILSYAR